MKRRGVLIRSAVIAVGLAFAPMAAQAEAATDAVLRQLEDYGYRDVHLRKTFLGRIQITATRGGQTREIVLDPRTGEILRDLTRGRSGTGTAIRDDRAGSSFGSGNSGSGRDDDSDDDRDDDDDDDHSGSGNSGSGGGSDDDGGDDSDDDDDDD